MWPDPPGPPTDDPRPFSYPEGDFLTLAAATTRTDDGPTLYLQADVDDFALPFSLSLLLGARFEDAADAPETSLVRLCYPALREVVAEITGRSPLPEYRLPPQRR